ncbi:MAG: lamin tail domain-containing protein [Myxococcales bacterium]|nr:lamin tail domain-containing protein [Myxococcales bacterium]
MLGLALLAVGGCAGGSAGDDADGDVPVAVPEGKEDDFLSVSAREYVVEGVVRLELDPADAALSDAARLEKVRRLIPFKQVVVAWFLNAWIGPKDGEDKNFGYGGFSALTKNGSYEDLDVRKVDATTYTFLTRQTIGGPLDLLTRLPTKTDAAGKRSFDLVLGRVSVEDMQKLAAGAEWFRGAPWEDFDPRGLAPDGLETVHLSIAPEPASLDGWVDTARLFADGKVTIGVHFGWDYHDAAHLRSSRKLFAYLVKNGYKPPVATYEALERTSGPFTKTLVANGKPVKIELSMFWGQPGSSTDPDTDAGGRNLKKDLVKSLETREVVIYSGHSGPFWGFSMANWNKTEAGELEDNEIATLNLPTSYQLVLAEGCETYALGEAFFANPAKASRTNVDIVTTTTYSTAEDADPVVTFLEGVVGEYTDGTHAPSTYGELLQALDYNAWDPAMYGVHGVDDAPHLHPYADPARFCETCRGAADCGAEGNFCVKLGADGRRCTAACTGDDGCPAGYACAAIASGATVTGRACVPRSFSCRDGAANATQAVVVNEVLADPPAGAEGDANGDGRADAAEDEFVELVNASPSAVALDGWTLSDGARVRFTFPTGTTLGAGKAAVVFGGGRADGLAGTGALGFVADAGLSLANAGDSVVLRNARGVVVDRMVYGAEGGRDRSLVRATDGAVGAGWVPHAGAAFSPGLRQGGGPF